MLTSVVKEFDATHPFFGLISAPNGSYWDTIPTLASRFGPRMILGIFPAYLQIEFPFHRAMRDIEMPVCTLVEEQLAAGAALVDTLQIGGILARQEKIPEFAAKVPKRISRPLYYQSVIGMREVVQTPPENVNVFQEVHLFPGVVGFFQCETLAHERRGRFHPSEKFTWEIDEGEMVVREHEEALFRQFKLPRKVEISYASCACSKETIVQFV